MQTSNNKRNTTIGAISLATVLIVIAGIALAASGKLHPSEIVQNLPKRANDKTSADNVSSTQTTNPYPISDTTLVRGGLYEQLAKSNPRGTEFLGYINAAFDKLSNSDKSDDEAAYLDIGFYKNELGDSQGGIQAYEAGITRFPKDETMIANLAHLFEDTKDYTNSEKEFQYLINVDPHNIRAYTDLADLYSLYIPAKKSLIPQLLVDNGLKYNPNEENLELYIADYYRANGDAAQAIAYYQKILVQDPKNTSVQTELRTLQQEQQH